MGGGLRLRAGQRRVLRLRQGGDCIGSQRSGCGAGCESRRGTMAVRRALRRGAPKRAGLAPSASTGWRPDKQAALPPMLGDRPACDVPARAAGPAGGPTCAISARARCRYSRADICTMSPYLMCGWKCASGGPCLRGGRQAGSARRGSVETGRQAAAASAGRGAGSADAASAGVERRRGPWLNLPHERERT